MTVTKSTYNSAELLKALTTSVTTSLQGKGLTVCRDSSKIPVNSEYVFIDQIDKVRTQSLKNYTFELFSFDICVHLNDTRSDLERVALAIEDLIYPNIYHLSFNSLELKPISYQSHFTDRIFHILVDYQFRTKYVTQAEATEEEALMMTDDLTVNLLK